VGYPTRPVESQLGAAAVAGWVGAAALVGRQLGGRRGPGCASGGLVGPWVGVNTASPAREPYPPMTSAEHHHPERDLAGLDPHPQQDPLALSELIAAGDIDVVPGDPPVPIAVWRVAGVDAGYGHADADALSPRMAALLVGSYTRPGQTILSVGDDVALAGAAGAGGRTH